MKTHGLIRLALLAITALGMQNAHAGSAVAFGPHNALVTVAGLPESEAKQRALARAREKYGPRVKIIASSDVAGYGAIAVARHPNGVGWIICVSLGRRSPTEADTLAMQKCAALGGKNPQVKWAFGG